MFNYANDMDIFKKYALMVSGKDIGDFPNTRYYCGFVGIKKKIDTDYEWIRKIAHENHGKVIVTDGPIATIFSAALGDYSFILKSESFEEVREAAGFILGKS